MPADCLFCKIGAGEIPATVVHETSRTIAFRDIDPKAPVHVLVIPKEHYETIGDLALADPQLAGEVCATAGKVAELEGVVKSGRLAVAGPPGPCGHRRRQRRRRAGSLPCARPPVRREAARPDAGPLSGADDTDGMRSAGV